MNRSPFTGFGPPPPPVELRARVLNACGDAVALRERLNLLDRLWESRNARLAWLAALMALMAANLVVNPQPRTVGERISSASSYDPAAEEEVLQVPVWRPRPRHFTWIEAGPGWGRLQLELE